MKSSSTLSGNIVEGGCEEYKLSHILSYNIFYINDIASKIN